MRSIPKVQAYSFGKNDIVAGIQNLPSTSMPLGTKGTEPVAMIISFADITVSEKPTFPYFTFCGP